MVNNRQTIIFIVSLLVLGAIIFFQFNQAELKGHATYEVQDFGVCGGTLDCTLLNSSNDEYPEDCQGSSVCSYNTVCSGDVDCSVYDYYPDTCVAAGGGYAACEWNGACEGEPNCDSLNMFECEPAYGGVVCAWDEGGYCYSTATCDYFNDIPEDCDAIDGCTMTEACTKVQDCSDLNEDDCNDNEQCEVGWTCTNSGSGGCGDIVVEDDCGEIGTSPGCTWITCLDGDGDNYGTEGGDCGPIDCNDTNASIHPGATEVCNDVDDDCDGEVDEGIICAVCGDNVTEGSEECDGEVCCDVDCTFLDSSNVCRASAGVCDEAETCTGSNANCPSDSVKSSSVVCRASTGNCDPEETCDGTNVDCPADVNDYCTYKVCVGTKDCSSTSEAHCISPACIWEEVVGTDPCTGGPQCDGNPMDLAVDACEAVGGCTWVYECVEGTGCGSAPDQSTCENLPYSDHALCEWAGAGYCRDDFGCAASYFSEEVGNCPTPVCAEEYGTSSECADVADASCNDITNETNCEGVSGCSLQECEDLDNDGYGSEGGDCGVVDCDDSDANVNPGAEEICNDIDDDCDGEIDEGDVCPTTSTGPLNLFVPDADLGKGYEKIMLEQWKVSFNFKGGSHTVTVSDIGSNRVTLVVRSEEQIVDLAEGETKKVDLDADEVYDLQIFLKTIVDGKADLVFTTISEEIIKSNIRGESFTAPAESEGLEDQGLEDVTPEEAYNWTPIVLLIIFIGIFVYYFFMKKK